MILAPFRAAWLALALSAACAAPVRPSPVASGHPADPGSATADVAPPPDPFELTPTFALPGTTSAPHAAPGAAEGGHGDAAATLYTCPMHPEVRSATPGNCPECGMALRPVPEHEHRAEGGRGR